MKILTLTLLLILFSGSILAMGGKDKRNMLKALDSNGDKAISFEEFKAAPNKRFESKDLNNDGVLTLDEIQQHQADREAERQARVSERSQKAGERFNSLDANSDGTVTLEEAQQGMFNRLDADGNGLITREEAKEARGKHKRHRRPHRDPAEDAGEG